MNRASEIIDFLAEPRNPDVLILAPNAPPVSRTHGAVEVAISSVFDAQDVTDTLGAFRTRALAASADTAISTSGSFSFGIRDVGRFRVTHATQRGSRIVSIARIPLTPPDLDVLCDDPTLAAKANDLLRDGGPGMVAVCGPNAVSNATFSYALIQSVNRTCNRVLYVLERTLTFLIRHENSVVIQCELHTDVKTMDEGLDVAALFEPDIMYIGDLKPGERLTGITHAIENGALVLLSSVMLNAQTLCNRYMPDHRHIGQSEDVPATAFLIQPMGSDKIATTVMENIRRSHGDEDTMV